MALSISQLAKDHQEFVLTKLKEAEQVLHPSSTEDEELVRRAVFSVRNKSIVFERFNGVSSILYASVQDVRPASVEIDFSKRRRVVIVLKQNGADIKSVHCLLFISILILSKIGQVLGVHKSLPS